MNPQAAPAPTPVPIHDIVGPIAFFPYPIWMVALLALAVLALLALVVWFFGFRRRSSRPLSAVERAVGELARLRASVATADPHAFSIAVSDVLRVYLRDVRGLSATTQTSREFLESARTYQAFNDEERSALAGFLEKADLIKFARLHATTDDSAGLLDQADRLIRSRGPEPAGSAK